MGQSSARLTILPRSQAKVNTVITYFLPNAASAREWNKEQNVVTERFTEH
jgi:hypothetical protein